MQASLKIDAFVSMFYPFTCKHRYFLYLCYYLTVVDILKFSHFLGDFVKAFVLVTVVFSLFFNLCAFNLASASEEEALFLQNVAKEYMLAQFSHKDNDVLYEVKVSKVDKNRDYGGKCVGNLTAELVDKQIKRSNVVKITCSRKETPYVISIPVNVIVKRPITIALVNIAKGTIITKDMLSKEYVNENTSLSSSITNLDSIIGAKAKKDIRAGDAIKQSDLCLIAKGDLVTIEAVSNNLQIKTQGIALEEGKLSDTISVKNAKSKKVIQAIVTGPSTVRVVF